MTDQPISVCLTRAEASRITDSAEDLRELLSHVTEVFDLLSCELAIKGSLQNDPRAASVAALGARALRYTPELDAVAMIERRVRTSLSETINRRIKEEAHADQP